MKFFKTLKSNIFWDNSYYNFFWDRIVFYVISCLSHFSLFSITSTKSLKNQKSGENKFKINLIEENVNHLFGVFVCLVIF